MTDRQLSNARKAQAEYLSYLRKWEAYTRSGEAFKPGRADMEDAVTFCLGKFADTKNELYQLFRAHLSGRTEAERREFDERRGNVRAAFDALDGTNGLEKLSDALKTEAAAVESFVFGTGEVTLPDLLEDLAPDKNKRDAIQYCASLVCHVWNTGEHGGKKRSTDYVFMKAPKGDSLFGECKRARELLKRWTISPGTVQTEAARLHAAQSGTKHKKRDGMERPETMHEAGKKSRAKEQAEIRAEERAQGKRKAKQGARQSGKKR